MTDFFDNIVPVDLSPLVAYQLYSSIKLHFTNKKYSFVKYGLNKSKFSENSLGSFYGNIYFKKASESFLYKDRYIPVLVSMLYDNPHIPFQEIFTEKYVKLGFEFRKYMADIKTYFVNDLTKIVMTGKIQKLSDLYLDSSRNNYFKLMDKKVIHPITAAILNKLFYTKYCSNTSLSFIYDDRSFYLNRLTDFLPSIDEEEYLKIVNNALL